MSSAASTKPTQACQAAPASRGGTIAMLVSPALVVARSISCACMSRPNADRLKSGAALASAAVQAGPGRPPPATTAHVDSASSSGAMPRGGVFAAAAAIRPRVASPPASANAHSSAAAEEGGSAAGAARPAAAGSRRARNSCSSQWRSVANAHAASAASPARSSAARTESALARAATAAGEMSAAAPPCCDDQAYAQATRTTSPGRMVCRARTTAPSADRSSRAALRPPAAA
mmetsp:Transcript_32959/g.84215  ORF Transcript_32959/g.84215 Transcript_32959/m.84215 type:complete len:232 (+) Transcript_32959:442-1137(+)